MADASDADVCVICLGGMVRGQASFTAECSHAFHLNCISASVVHGNHNCPLCKALWTVLPAVNAPRAPPPPPPPSTQQVPRRTYEDDPVQEIVQAEAESATNGGAVVLKTHCECPAVARGSSRDNFAVLVHVKAPSAAAFEAARAPLDLVAVLDFSGSMMGPKLALLKQAMGFVIDNLRSADRLSVVSFNHNARRLIRLVRTSDTGKAEAKRAVESLVTNGATNIGDGLRVAAQVLDGRRYKNAVTSIMLLTDGQDTFTASRHGSNGANYINLVPSSLTYAGAGNRPPAVHAFGFGTDHDAAVMHTIAEVTGGTFSFIENEAVLQDSFAQCLGGLLTVAVQEAHITMTGLHPGVCVREVKSGRYDNSVDTGGRAASVDVGELYADEERRFLIFGDIPEGAEDTDDEVTGLVKLSCTYRDAATGQAVNVAGDDAVVQRPVEVTNVEPSMEVERERVRVAATGDMAAAREAADRGEHAEGARILRRGLEAAARSASRMGYDPMSTALEDEMHDLIARVEDPAEYESTGHACFLSGMSSRRQQRAGASMMMGQRIPLSLDDDDDEDDDEDEDEAEDEDEDEDGEGDEEDKGREVLFVKKKCKRQPQAYVTPAMAEMVKRSRDERKKIEPPQKKNKKGVSRGSSQATRVSHKKRHRKH